MTHGPKRPPFAPPPPPPPQRHRASEAPGLNTAVAPPTRASELRPGASAPLSTRGSLAPPQAPPRAARSEEARQTLLGRAELPLTTRAQPADAEPFTVAAVVAEPDPTLQESDNELKRAPTNNVQHARSALPPPPQSSSRQLPPAYPFLPPQQAKSPSLSDFAEPWLRTGQFDALTPEQLAEIDDDASQFAQRLAASSQGPDADVPPTEMMRFDAPLLGARQVAPSLIIDFDDDGLAPNTQASGGHVPTAPRVGAAFTLHAPIPPQHQAAAATIYSSVSPPPPPKLGGVRAVSEVEVELADHLLETGELEALTTGELPLRAPFTQPAATRKPTAKPPPPPPTKRVARSQDPALQADAALLFADADLAASSQVFDLSGGADFERDREPRTLARGETFVSNPERERLWSTRDFQGLLAYLEAGIEHTEAPNELAELHADLGRLHDEELTPDRAMTEFGKALEYQPHLRSAQVGLDQSARKLQSAAASKWHEVAAGLRRATERSPKDSRLGGWFELLYRIHANELKRRDLAADYYGKLARLEPTHCIVVERLANEARAQGDAKRQAEYLERAISVAARSDDRARIFLALGEVHEGPLAQAARALAHFESARAETEASPAQRREALRSIERLARAAGDPERVVSALRELLHLEMPLKEQVDARIRLAEVLEKELGENGAAVVELQAVLQSDPGNRKALSAVERCQVALGAWPEVAEATRAKAEATSGTRQRIELFFSAAEIYERKAHDLAAAFESLRQVSLIDERNKRALTDLRRLGEALGRWEDATAFGVRLAELTPDKREASRMHAELGAMLLGMAGDELGARLQFDKAADLDRKNIGALEALERIARSSGDRAALGYLEKRAQAADDKTTRAQLYVELAREYVQAGDGPRALAAYEHALRADAGVLEAAAALLEHHLAAGRFAEAAPLCEQLIAAAPQGESVAHRVRRLRLATRIRASLGAEDQALAAALRAFRSAPTDDGTRDDLLEVATRIDPARLAAARADFGQIADKSLTLTPDIELKLARALAASGDPARALGLLESAFKKNPRAAAPLVAMEGIFTATSNWQRAAECKVVLAEMLPSQDARFAKLCEAGDLWTRELGDVKAAARAFEKARLLRPNDPWILDTLCWAYDETREFRRLAEVLRQQCENETDLVKRRTRLNELAELELRKLQNPRGAMAVYEEMLESDPSRLDVFEALVAAGTEADEHRALERAYRKMLGRVTQVGDRGVLVHLWAGLGRIYQERLDDPLSALEAFRMCVDLEAEDPSYFELGIQICYQLGRVDAAVALCRSRVSGKPYDARAYDLLFDLFYRIEKYDLAWCALDVLRQLESLTPEQETFYGNYPPYEPHEIPGALTAEAWTGYLLHPDLDPHLTAMLAWATPASARADAAPNFDPPLTAKQTPYADALYDLFAQLGAVLGVATPPLFPGQDAQQLSTLRNPYAAVAVNVRDLEANQATLPFHIAKSLAEQRPELIANAFYPNPQLISQLIARAVKPDAALLRAMSTEEAETLGRLVARATNAGAKFDVRRWSLLAHVSAGRAAILTRGTVHEAAAYYNGSAGDPLASETLGMLYAFAVSDEYAALRKAIGSAVGS